MPISVDNILTIVGTGVQIYGTERAAAEARKNFERQQQLNADASFFGLQNNEQFRKTAITVGAIAAVLLTLYLVFRK